MTANITNPSNPPIDKSLTIENAAADAKVTGDKINSLKEDLDELVDLKVNLKNITKPEGYLLYNKKVNIPSGKYRFIFDILFSGNNKTGTIYFQDSNGNDVKTKDIPNNKFVFDEEIEFSDNVSIITI